MIVIAIGGGVVALLAVNQAPTPSPTRPSASLPTVSREPQVPPPPPGVTFSDFVVDPTIVRSPTTSTAQSKLWFADGAWWGALFGPSTQRLGIFRLDPATQVWGDTGVLIDERPFVDADVVWTGEQLYTVAGGSRPSENHAIRVRRFSYDATTTSWKTAPDFPVTIHPAGSNPAVMTIDSTGVVWVTFVVDSHVWTTHTLENDNSWSKPVALPGMEATVDLADVSAMVAFGPGRVGVMWTNQRAGVYFSTHEDGTPDDAWTPPEPVLTGQRPDEQLSLTTYPLGSGAGSVAAALSTTNDETGRGLDPLTLLATRDEQGKWDTALVGLVRDRHARPVVLVDPDQRTVAVAATSPGNGGVIYYKRSPLDRIEFDTGIGVPLVASQVDTTLDHATSSKGPLTTEAGLLVLAADRTSGRYVHGVVDLGGGPPDADPADPERPTTPTAPPKGTATTLLQDTFEPWPIGRASGSTGWYVRPEDPAGSLSIVADGGSGQALRVPSSATGVRGCRDFAEIPEAVVTVRARVRLSRIGLDDATILSVRGSGGEAASIRVTNLGVVAWFNGATKVRSTARFRPGVWYRITARLDQARRTYDFRVSTDGGTRVASAGRLRWRMPTVQTIGTVCAETAGAPPAQAIDFADVSVVQTVTP